MHLLERSVSEEFLAVYGHHLTEELDRCSHFRVLPGVTRLLTRLDQSEDFLTGLATGNVAAGARRKLGKGNLLPFFQFGGFGCDSESRSRNRTSGEYCEANGSWGSRFSGKSVVVGDTPRDILHAREAGVKAVGVTTGRFDRGATEGLFSRRRCSLPWSRPKKYWRPWNGSRFGMKN